MLATSAVDKTVTLWDTSSGGTPRAKMNKDMKVGKLFTLNFYPSSPWLLGCAGNGKEIATYERFAIQVGFAQVEAHDP